MLVQVDNSLIVAKLDISPKSANRLVPQAKLCICYHGGMNENHTSMIVVT